uniref:Uncharacterized protein n=1 Tax=Anguilla anguilla TaxID=7936 RepID=A0A0E9SVB8_ANGAN
MNTPMQRFQATDAQATPLTSLQFRAEPHGGRLS